jgi:hypothetical protein
VRPAREHPRLAAAIAAALVLLVLAAAGAASALAGGSSAGGVSAREFHAANAQIGRLQRRLQLAFTEGAMFRAEVGALQARVQGAQLRMEVGALKARLALVRDLQPRTVCRVAARSRNRKR